MRKKLFVFLFVSLTTVSFAQSDSWVYFLDTQDDRRITDLIEGEANNIYFTGLVQEVNSLHFKGTVFKLGQDGIALDSIFFGNHDSSIIVTNILPDTSAGYLLGLSMTSKTQQMNACSFSIKQMNDDLEILSSSKKYIFPPEYHTIKLNLQYGINNNIFAYGYIFPLHTPRMFIYELNRSFDSIQAKIYLDSGAILPFLLKQLPNKNLWIIRELHPNYALVDSSFTLISKEYAATPHALKGPYGIKWDSDSSFFTAGDYFDHGAKNVTNASHDVGFFHQYHPFDTTGFSDFDYVGAIDTNDRPANYGALDYQSKDSIFIGYIKNIDETGNYYSSYLSWFALLQTDSMLNIRWEHFYGGDAYYHMDKLIATSDGGCIMAGTRFDNKVHPGIHERDIYILKVNAEGLITSTNEQPASIVHDAIVYPNPGSNMLKVQVATQHPESIFKLYNMSGELVLLLPIHGKTAAFNTTFLPPATYVYTITAKTGLNEKGKWVKE